jgi:hypothetical protein
MIIRMDRIEIWEHDVCNGIPCYHPPHICDECNHNMKNNSFKRFRDARDDNIIWTSATFKSVKAHQNVLTPDEISERFMKQWRNQHIDALAAIIQLLSEDNELMENELYLCAIMHLHSAYEIIKKHREE